MSSIAGAGTRRKKRTTGRPTSRSRKETRRATARARCRGDNQEKGAIMRNKIWTTTFALIALSVAPSLHKRDWNVFAGRFIPPAHAAPDVAVPPDELTGAASGAGVPNAKERLHG